MNRDLSGKKAKNNFEKDFFKLMNNVVLRKTMDKLKRHRYIKLKTTENKRIIQYQNQTIIQQFVFWKSVSKGNEKNARTYEKQVYIGLPILLLNKIVMYDSGMII